MLSGDAKSIFKLVKLSVLLCFDASFLPKIGENNLRKGSLVLDALAGRHAKILKVFDERFDGVEPR